MDKKLYKYLSQVQALDDDPCIIDPAPEVRTEDDLSRVLDSIFSVDPDSGLPMTDVSYYLSRNANPTVREWLINNLMKPRAASRVQTEGVDDDMLVEFSRIPGETNEQYSQRIYNLGVEAKKYYDSHKDDLNQ